MFHFPTFPPHALCVQAWVTGHDSCRVSPFGNPRIKARLAAPRGLSQPPTSFIGSWCQGIHRAPLLTWHYSHKKDARVHCAVLKVRAIPLFELTAYDPARNERSDDRWYDVSSSASPPTIRQRPDADAKSVRELSAFPHLRTQQRACRHTSPTVRRRGPGPKAGTEPY